MAEAHQPEGIVLVLGPLDVLRDAVDCADFQSASAVQLRLHRHGRDPHRHAIPAEMQANGLAPEEPASLTRRGVLLVVGMQDEDAAHRLRKDRIDLVFLTRYREAHVQEVGRVVELVLWIDEGLADRIFVGHGRDGRHLGDHPVARNLALSRILDVSRIVVEGRERYNYADHDGHGMRITPESGVEPPSTATLPASRTNIESACYACQNAPGKVALRQQPAHSGPPCIELKSRADSRYSVWAPVPRSCVPSIA
jgi:hypothetical protein